MQEKAPIFFKSSCYSKFLIHFSIRKKWPTLCLRIPVLQSKQVILIRSTPTYLRCIADQTWLKYYWPTLYRRPPRCIPAQHTTRGERDHPRPFSNRLKTLSRSPPLRAGPTNLWLGQSMFNAREDSLVWTGLKGPCTPESRSTPALSCKMDGSAMSGPWSGRAYVGLKYSGEWSGPLWEVMVSRISFSTGWKQVLGDPALHTSYVERGYSVVVGGSA